MLKEQEKKREDLGAPKRRKEGLVVEELPDEVLVYDLERHRAHCLNRTSALVWKYCNGKRSIPELVQSLERELKTPVDEDVVWLALQQLSKFHLLQTRFAPPTGSGHISRRELVQKYLPAALTVPFILSISTPTAAQAATCGAVGSACTTNARCCSGICMNGQCVCLGACTGCTSDAQCCSGKCGSAINKCLPCA